jgi:hypothetical protein
VPRNISPLQLACAHLIATPANASRPAAVRLGAIVPGARLARFDRLEPVHNECRSLPGTAGGPMRCSRWLLAPVCLRIAV